MLTREEFAQIITLALDQRFTPLLYFSAVSKNGSLFFVRYDCIAGEAGMQGDHIASYHLDDFFEFPINIMITEQKGKAT